MTVATNKKGFTLIEIVIVLAIAALILAGVLIAVSGAQKSRRDTQRKDDTGKIASYLEQSASNNSGNYPGGAGGAAVGTFNTNYITSNNLQDPSSATAYTLPAPVVGAIPANCGAWASSGTIRYYLNGRKYKLCMDLESKDSAPFAN